MPKNIPQSFFINQFEWIKACNNTSNFARCDLGPTFLINILLPNLIVLAGIIFFILIVYYGWRLVENAGGEQGPQQLHKAQQAVTYSIIGFLLIVTAFFVLQIVGTLTGIDFTNPKSF